ncbi:MAG TPA: hypothetical protein VJ875_06525 [Pyrinomonadaceae bacterium]|nr:hypothetical protein [Pyrinomonadaceae bacterium]
MRSRIDFFIPAAGAPPMRSLALGQRVLGRGRQALDDLAFLISQVSPSFESSFLATRAGLLVFHVK